MRIDRRAAADIFCVERWMPQRQACNCSRVRAPQSRDSRGITANGERVLDHMNRRIPSFLVCVLHVGPRHSMESVAPPATQPPSHPHPPFLPCPPSKCPPPPSLSSAGVAHCFVMVPLLSEATAPFINGRWFMSQLRLKNNPLYLLNGIAIVVLWFLVRLLLILWLGWQHFWVWREPFNAQVALAHRAVLAMLYVPGAALQFMWFGKILQGFFKVITMALKPQKKTV